MSQPLVLKTSKSNSAYKAGIIERSQFDRATKTWGSPRQHEVRVRTISKGHYAIGLKVDGEFVKVGSVDQQAVGIYSLNFVSGSAYRDRLTLAQAVEVVCHSYLQDAEYRAYQTSPAGLAEKAKEAAAQAAREAEYEATQNAAQVRKAALADLGITSDGFSLTADQIDALLALVPVTVA